METVNLDECEIIRLWDVPVIDIEVEDKNKVRHLIKTDLLSIIRAMIKASKVPELSPGDEA